MAAVGASDVTYTLQGGSQSYTADSKVSGVYKLVFGTGLTYPSGGIPLTKAKLNCPNSITQLSITDPGSGNGYSYKYNLTANSIQIYQADLSSHAHNMIVVGGAGAASTNALQVEIASSGFKMQLAGAQTIAGNTTVGGISLTTLAATALTELTTAATVGATTLYVHVTGW